MEEEEEEESEVEEVLQRESTALAWEVPCRSVEEDRKEELDHILHILAVVDRRLEQQQQCCLLLETLDQLR